MPAVATPDMELSTDFEGLSVVNAGEVAGILPARSCPDRIIHTIMVKLKAKLALMDSSLDVLTGRKKKYTANPPDGKIVVNNIQDKSILATSNI